MGPHQRPLCTLLPEGGWGWCPPPPGVSPAHSGRSGSALPFCSQSLQVTWLTSPRPRVIGWEVRHMTQTQLVTVCVCRPDHSLRTEMNHGSRGCCENGDSSSTMDTALTPGWTPPLTAL